MKMKKKFHIGDVLSITTGRLVSPRGMEGVHDIVNFIMCEEPSTYQYLDADLIIVALEILKLYLLKQHPQLKDVDASEVTPENWQEWLDKQIARYGEYLIVRRVPGICNENGNSQSR